MKVFIFIFFLLSFSLFLFFGSDIFYGRGDILWYFLSQESLENAKTVISKNDFGGINQFSLYYFISILGEFFPQNFLQFFLYSLLTFLKLLLSFFFFINFIKNTLQYEKFSEKNLYLYAGLASLFFVFNPYVLQKYFYWSFSVFQLFIPLVWLLVYFITGKELLYKKSIFITIILSIFLYSPFLITNPPYVLLICLFFIILLGLRFQHILYKRLFGISVVSILLMVPYILNYFLVLYFSGEINTEVGGSWFWTHRNLSLINLVTGHGPWAFNSDYFLFFKYFDSFLYRSIFFGTIFFGIIVLFLKKKYVGFIGTFLALLFLTKGIQEPFGDVFSYLNTNLPLFFLFREPIKFLILLYFFAAIIYILSMFHIKSAPIRKIGLFLMLLLLSLNIVPFLKKDIMMGGTKHNNYKNTIFSIPKEYYVYDNFYKKERTLLLPISDSYQAYYNFNFLGTEDVENRMYGGQIINSPDGYLYNQQLKQKLHGLYENICNTTTLGELGITQIIYRKYIHILNDLDGINKNIFDALQTCELFQKTFSDENIIVYTVSSQREIFFSDSTVKYLLILENLKDPKYIISYNIFNLYWKIYLKNKEGLFEKPLFENTHKKAYNYSNSWLIDSQTIINYVNEVYGKELIQEGYPKNMVGGKQDFKYYIQNPDGSIDVYLTLYFKPQIYFSLSLLISLFTLVSLIFFLTYFFIRKKYFTH